MTSSFKTKIRQFSTKFIIFNQNRYHDDGGSIVVFAHAAGRVAHPCVRSLDLITAVPTPGIHAEYNYRYHILPLYITVIIYYHYYILPLLYITIIIYSHSSIFPLMNNITISHDNTSKLCIHFPGAGTYTEKLQCVSGRDP